MRPLLTFIAFITIVFTSCFRESYTTLQRVDLTSAERFEVKTMAGCYGCKAIFYNVTRNNKISEQFVVETDCGLYEPTKHLFTTDIKGEVTNIKSLIAVTDSSFTFPLTEIDKIALLKLDSIYANWRRVYKRQIVFADITGFKEGEKTHMPLGVKVTVPSLK